MKRLPNDFSFKALRGGQGSGTAAVKHVFTSCYVYCTHEEKQSHILLDLSIENGIPDEEAYPLF